MSGVKCRPEVIQVKIASIQNAVPIRTIGQVVQSISNSFQEKTQTVVHAVLKDTGALIKPSILAAVPQIAKKMTILQSNAIKTASNKGVTSLKAQKIAAIATISNYTVKDVPLITTAISKILLSKDRLALTKAVNIATKIAQKQHEAVFVSNLATVCSKVSVNMGFATVSTKMMDNNIMRVVTKAKNQTQLITEIEVVQEHGKENVNMTTEVFGLSEKESTHLQNRFSQELKKQGVIYEGKYQCKKERLLEKGRIKKPYMKKAIQPDQIFDEERSISNSPAYELEKIKNFNF
ncbi:MAG: hypothetical protein COB67_09610 [SAR324 cluster bacterium]|uniref:Uncharacterized protein n=1 Tax=SAR324 cluster bacterium TaxID=2024889 RepID=A0A2A4T062_9DELT|nr:MAG: hypothetical protein COB67_09610 [SAR324 cluster bacterium]